jgi:hypothetical protein
MLMFQFRRSAGTTIYYQHHMSSVVQLRVYLGAILKAEEMVALS